MRRGVVNKLLGLRKLLDGLGEVNDMDPVAFAKDKRLHFGIPTLGLMTEVNACIEQVLNANI